MQIVIAILCGCGACTFGIWAFLKGQISMAEILTGGKPQNLKGPFTLLKENLDINVELDDNGYTEQLKALFGEDEKINRK